MISAPAKLCAQILALAFLLLFHQPTYASSTETSYAETSSTEDKIDFAEQVKPILSDKCFACHGPDQKQRVSDFRLDDPTSALDPKLNLIVPGKPDESLLVQRIHSTDPDQVMPPADQLKQLTPQQKLILRKWIQQGAQWEAHWAFRPLQNIAPASLGAGRWPGSQISKGNEVEDHPVDAFVLAKLKQRGIEPSAAAETQTLLRRLSLDLTGLSPSIEQQDEFARQIDESGFAAAYQNQVDQLLASPQFSERFAVYWLDLVRYADSVGYHGDQPVSVSPYRDWVINAFNSNMPFDQFTREQIAGDLLPNASETQLIASGYNRLGMMSAEGGVQPEEYLLKYAADRVRTTGTTWLGLTLGCAECHDHKFDPISTRDFYQFSAFFADIKEEGLYSGANDSGKWGPTIEIADPELNELLKPMDQQLASLQSQLQNIAGIAQKVESWEASLSVATQWVDIDIQSAETLSGAKLIRLEDGSYLASGTTADSDTYILKVDLPEGTRAIQLEAIPDANLPAGGSGRASNGNFVVTEFLLLEGDHSNERSAFAEVASLPEQVLKQQQRFEAAFATIEQTYAGEGHPDKRWSAASTIDNDQRGSRWGWAVLPDVSREQQLVMKLDHAVAGLHSIAILQNHGTQHNLGRFRIRSSQAADARLSPLAGLPKAVVDILKVPATDRNEQQSLDLVQYWLGIAPELEPLRQQIQDVKSQREQIRKSHTRPTLITVSVPAREVRILARGNWMDKSGPVVSPAVPEVLGSIDKETQANRLDLANWLTSRNNPIVARVFVNRLWRMYFGKGLSNVLDDLGSQGEPPSHPMLLDFLAREFSSDWDIKRTIRLIVTSNTYQQASDYRQDLKAIDPENRLLARQSRFRLDAEFIRDHALSVSGLLVNQIGGASVYPYQPEGLYRHLNFPTRSYSASTGSDQYRRGLYTHWQRQFLHPAMKTFDAPPREECTAARPRSSTPLAALLLLNDPSYVEAARALADRVMLEQAESSERINQMFRLGMSRNATDKEQQVLLELLRNHRDFFSNNIDEARQLLQVGLKPETLESDQQAAEKAAWTSVARTVMNMHEFISRR